MSLLDIFLIILPCASDYSPEYPFCKKHDNQKYGVLQYNRIRNQLLGEEEIIITG